MRDVNTQMWFRRPITAGTSNDSSPRTTMIKIAAYSAGLASGSVTRKKTRHIGAPLMIADSSSDGSIERNDATISRKTSGARCTPSMKIIPGRLYVERVKAQLLDEVRVRDLVDV